MRWTGNVVSVVRLRLVVGLVAVIGTIGTFCWVARGTSCSLALVCGSNFAPCLTLTGVPTTLKRNSSGSVAVWPFFLRSAASLGETTLTRGFRAISANARCDSATAFRSSCRACSWRLSRKADKPGTRGLSPPTFSNADLFLPSCTGDRSNPVGVSVILLGSLPAFGLRNWNGLLRSFVISFGLSRNRNGLSSSCLFSSLMGRRAPPMLGPIWKKVGVVLVGGASSRALGTSPRPLAKTSASRSPSPMSTTPPRCCGRATGSAAGGASGTRSC